MKKRQGGFGKDKIRNEKVFGKKKLNRLNIRLGIAKERFKCQKTSKEIRA